MVYARAAKNTSEKRKRNLEVRIAEHSNIKQKSEPAHHRQKNPGHTFHCRILFNPILHGGGGGVVALISIVENFGEIQAIVVKLGDFS